jgi:hypothetical protein
MVDRVRAHHVEFWRSVALALVAAVAFSAPATVDAEQPAANPVKISPWPCRVIVKPTLDKAWVNGLQRSPTIRRQCEELAAARAVVELVWGAFDSDVHAKTALEVQDGVVVARVKLPPNGDIIVLLAHELHHVLEKTRGLDVVAESNRPGSGVWKAAGGYETQAAVDVSRQVSSELREARRKKD